MDARSRLVSLALGLLGFGCASLSGNLPGEARQPLSQPVARLQVDSRPVPELRIPVTPTPPAAPPAAGPSLVQASAQAPAPPDPAGPPLKLVAPPPTGNLSADRIHALYREAAQRYATVDSYIVRLKRREQINGKDHPEEVLYVRFRKQPWSIYFKWLGKEGAGREVLYVKGQYEDKIQTIVAAGDVPLMPAGRRFAVSPDSLFVKSASRYSIRDAGIGNLIERFGALLEANDKGDRHWGTVRYLGPVKRPECEAPYEAVEHDVPGAAEAQLPRGGRRLWLFDPVTKFPTLLITQDETGHEVEYYCYDRFQFPVKLDDDDFNPDKLWNQKKAPPSEATPMKRPSVASPSER
jgi:hypothetical protein